MFLAKQHNKRFWNEIEQHLFVSCESRKYLGMFWCRLEVVYAFLLSLVHSTHVEKSTFNLAWLTDIMGQTSGEGCIYIFRNLHEIYRQSSVYTVL